MERRIISGGGRALLFEDVAGVEVAVVVEVVVDRGMGGGELLAPGSAQRFLAVHAATFNVFTHQRHLLRRPHFKELRAGSFRTWAAASATA